MWGRSRGLLVAAAALQLVAAAAGLVQASRWLMMPWPSLGEQPIVLFFHMLAISYGAGALALIMASVGLVRARRWGWRASWAAALLAMVVLVTIPLIGIVEAGRGGDLSEELRMLAAAIPVTANMGLLWGAREAV
jgi:hypothetical protein